jgi:preprotein translocase subunit SecF
VRGYDFFGTRRVWFAVSLAVILAGAVFLALPNYGLRLGIDFVGGSILEARFERSDVTTSEIRSALAPLGYGEPVIQRTVDDPHRFLIRVRVFGDEERIAVQSAITAGAGKFTVERFEGIAGVIGVELTRRAMLAVAVASGLMLLYITVRFEFRFGVAAVAALMHDVAVTVAAFSVLQREINSSFVAAILTVVGYSINDTIIVFDRIRENLRARPYGRGETGAVINRSVRETLSRSINTSLTTLLAIGAVLAFGGRTTQDFALALMIGMLTGTYSSIFIASPIWGIWRERDFRVAAGARAAARAGAAGEQAGAGSGPGAGAGAGVGAGPGAGAGAGTGPGVGAGAGVGRPAARELPTSTYSAVRASGPQPGGGDGATANPGGAAKPASRPLPVAKHAGKQRKRKR